MVVGRTAGVGLGSFGCLSDCRDCRCCPEEWVGSCAVNNVSVSFLMKLEQIVP